MVTATLKNYRQSPRKVRLVANALRGKNVERAIVDLQFTIKRSADPLRKLLESAVANAKHNASMDTATLFVKEIRVDEGATLMRRIPRARGRSTPIRKRVSHVTVVLDSKGPAKKLTKKTETDTKKTTAKKTTPEAEAKTTTKDTKK